MLYLYVFIIQRVRLKNYYIYCMWCAHIWKYAEINKIVFFLFLTRLWNLRNRLRKKKRSYHIKIICIILICRYIVHDYTHKNKKNPPRQRFTLTKPNSKRITQNWYLPKYPTDKTFSLKCQFLYQKKKSITVAESHRQTTHTLYIYMHNDETFVYRVAPANHYMCVVLLLLKMD